MHNKFVYKSFDTDWYRFLENFRLKNINCHPKNVAGLTEVDVTEGDMSQDDMTNDDMTVGDMTLGDLSQDDMTNDDMTQVNMTWWHHVACHRMT